MIRSLLSRWHAVGRVLTLALAAVLPATLGLTGCTSEEEVAEHRQEAHEKRGEAAEEEADAAEEEAELREEEAEEAEEAAEEYQ